jgi:hypothetical protein
MTSTNFYDARTRAGLLALAAWTDRPEVTP